jgi:quinol monooxygenase YgiN
MTVLSLSGFYLVVAEWLVTMSSTKHNQIQFRAEITIQEGKIEEYKKVVQEMSRVVEANEPDTISYQFYLNRDETKCIVYETYSNSEAVFAHMNGVASQTILPNIFNVSKISKFEVYGNPSKELQKVLTSFSPQTYNLFTGFTR